MGATIVGVETKGKLRRRRVPNKRILQASTYTPSAKAIRTEFGTDMHHMQHQYEPGVISHDVITHYVDYGQLQNGFQPASAYMLRALATIDDYNFYLCFMTSFVNNCSL